VTAEVEPAIAAKAPKENWKSAGGTRCAAQRCEPPKRSAAAILCAKQMKRRITLISINAFDAGGVERELRAVRDHPAYQVLAFDQHNADILLHGVILPYREHDIGLGDALPNHG
jgi:hypothetical protein